MRYKQSHEADSLAESMRRQILEKDAEDKTHSSKLSEALDCLDKAAELLEDIGLTKSASVATKIIEKFAEGDK